MDRTIVESIEIEASPERVFSAWTDPEQLVAWWGDDKTYHTTSWESDLRVGGRWIARGKALDGSPYSVEGEYVQYDPPRHLGFTWKPSYDGSGPTMVELELTPTATGTLLTLRHSGFASDASAQGHRMGWQRIFGWMRAYVEPKKAVAQ
jgi:uncharacterized protein YndB with AHSA1/START domain